MMRFLVVGCGGSGGHTMAYLMDQLRSDLKKDGIDKLPAGWQFVFLDVPLAIQNGPEGVKNVLEQRQGATYLGLGTQGGKYAVLDHALTQGLANADGLGAYGSWASRRPDEEETAIDVGAGQYRAVGRAILLSKAERVRDRLREAYTQLSHDDTLSEMEQVSRRVHQTFDPGNPPLVLVISSMAGGAGASMALDVCRLLTFDRQVTPSLVSLFMVTPDIFDSLPEQARSGVRANALAMLGEIVASQTGAARKHDVEILKAVGVADPAGVKVPFARVFPVGRSVGLTKALIGDGSKEVVYRALARGLAGLMTSQVASEQFIAYDLGNRGYVPAKPQLFGWGAPAAPLPWGSYGFASISMGRDRYAEYAAQRIARSCVDRLVNGHLDPRGDADANRDGIEQARALIDLEWPTVCRALGLPASLAGQNAANDLKRWYTDDALPRSEVNSAAGQIVSQDLPLDNPYVTQATHWLEHIRRGLRQHKPVVTQRAEDESYRLAVRWLMTLAERVENTVADGISRHGLVYASGLLTRIQALLMKSLIPGTEAMSASRSGDITELPPEVVTTATAAGRNQLAGGDDLLRVVLNDVRSKIGGQMYASTARHLSVGLTEFVAGVLRPLQRSVDSSYTSLRAARQADLTVVGLAQLETDQYGAWPSEGDTRVPERFGEANNELMLTPSGEFREQFDLDLGTSLPPDLRGPNAFAEVITEVISGLWETVGGPPPGGLVVRRGDWWPRKFPLNPSTGKTVRPQDGEFEVAIRTGQLRERAMQFVQRPDTSFAKFCAVTLRDHVLGDRDVTEDSERARRQTDMVDKFRRALRLAVPLTSVDAQAVSVLHSGAEVRYVYKFSDIPLASASSSVSDDLREVITRDRNIDQSSVDNFNQALQDSGNPRRIDIFGSYPLYAPLAFNSILDPVIEQWESTPREGVREFWNMRRARPLDASLPIGDAERRAMVAGWLVGHIIGEVTRGDLDGTVPAKIWDTDEQTWVSFPHPMLTPPTLFRSKHDWLPAVLESLLLAVARAHRGQPMSSLRPYHLLRNLYDADPDGGREEDAGLRPKSAQIRLTEWLQRGTKRGFSSQVRGLDAASDVDERYRLANEWLVGATGPGELARRYRPAGVGDRSGSVIKTRQESARMPLFRDVALDVAWATSELETILVKAQRAARTPDPEPDPIVSDADDDIEGF